MPKEVVVLRIIKRIKDGAIKRVQEGMANKLVAKGLYEYADGGPDNSVGVKTGSRYKHITTKPSPIIDTTPLIIKERQIPTISQQKKAEAKERETERKVRKVSDIPPEQMNMIRSLNTGAENVVTPTRSSGSLKEIIERKRASRLK